MNLRAALAAVRAMLPGAAPGDDDGAARVARTTRRLAVLLGAGVAPASAWVHLAEEASADRTRALAGDAPVPVGAVDVDGEREVGMLLEVAAAAVHGGDVAAAIDELARQESGRGVRTAWAGLAAAWQVASLTGAPLGVCLRDLAGSLRELDRIGRDVGTALAGPAATARLVLWLPLVAVVLGMALGFDTVRTLVATVPGLCCLVLGAAFLVAGGRWSAALTARAARRDPAPGLSLDLVAVAMAGGGAASVARRVVEEACERFDVPHDDQSIGRVLALSASAGIPAGELLRSEADQCRDQARSDGERAAAVLATRLMIPLGVCILPAFLLVGVAPLLLSVVTSTALGF
ncbi:MAG TPA: type II secretion system F family protein [Plantibacter sp.]|uniref:type II secretion system F family protein n=1 Tax=unclassified Plantibacter TaxID=2624265 RepID=UPI002C6BD9B5|nr:type II secretion system F family protein [Plantibacter sp.]